MQATIKSTVGNDSVVEFVLSDGMKSTQTIAGVPIHDEVEAANFLKAYAEAYERGLETQKVQAVGVKPVAGLVGKSLDLSKPIEAPVLEV